MNPWEQVNDFNQLYHDFFGANIIDIDIQRSEETSVEYVALFNEIQSPDPQEYLIELSGGTESPSSESIFFLSELENDFNLRTSTNEAENSPDDLILQIEPCPLLPSYIHPQAMALSSSVLPMKREREEEKDFSGANKRPMLSVKKEEPQMWNFGSYEVSKVGTIQRRYNNLRKGIEHTLNNISQEIAFLKQTYQQVRDDFLTQGQFPPKPEGIIQDLMPYQWYGFKWMEILSKQRIGGCLADDMGLGKTIQSIALIQSVVNEKKSRGAQARILVSCPSNLIDNWKKEFQAKSADLSQVLCVIQGKESVPVGATIYLISHQKLRLDSKQAGSLLCTQQWDLVICDEFHSFLGSPISQNAIVNLRKRNSGFIGLTGTPMPNGLIELYKLNYLLNPHLYPKEKDFKSKCLNPAKDELRTLLKAKRAEGFVSQNYGVENLEEHLVQLIELLAKPFMLRRLKSQAEFSDQIAVMQNSHSNMSSLPSLKPEIQVLYEFTDFQTELIEAVVKNKNVEEEEKLDEQGVLSLFQINKKQKEEDEESLDLTDFLCLSQIADHPSILSDKLISHIQAEGNELLNRIRQLPDNGPETGKIKAISDLVQRILQDNPEDKILIFVNFEGMGKKVLKAIQKSNFSPAMKKVQFIYGKIPKAQRASKIADFQSDEGPSVMVLGRQIGSVGLNITRANHVIISDPWWNPNNDDQCVGRTYRIGQKKQVHVYRLYRPDFVVDVKTNRLCVEKRTWCDLILSQDSSQVPQLVRQFIST